MARAPAHRAFDEITIVAWQWRGDDPRRQFLPEHATAQARQFRRTLSYPHRYVCISDEESGFGPEVEVFKTPASARWLASFKSPEGGRFPSCYRRLWSFSNEAMCLGPRICVVDIDFVILKDLAWHLDRHEDMVGWRPIASWGKENRIGGGMYLLKTGSRSDVYDSFKGPSSIAEARRAGFRGSDQAWMSYKLGTKVPLWPRQCGLYSIRDLKNGQTPLPKNAVAVQFNGQTKPWHSALPWVKQHWYG